MILTIAQIKGGVGKTTTAIHIAGCLQLLLGSTILSDGDIVRASVKWASRGPGMSFKVVPIGQLAKEARTATYQHIVSDTEANPSDEDFEDIAQGCDLLIIPAEPGLISTDGLNHTLEKLRKIGHTKYKILLTKVPPKPQTEGQQLYADLVAKGYPVFKTQIPFLVAYRKAADEGILTRDLKGDKNAWRAWAAYRRVVEEIIGDK
jgi:chromosome partitioning protein